MMIDLVLFVTDEFHQGMEWELLLFLSKFNCDVEVING